MTTTLACVETSSLVCKKSSFVKYSAATDAAVMEGDGWQSPAGASTCIFRGTEAMGERRSGLERCTEGFWGVTAGLESFVFISNAASRPVEGWCTGVKPLLRVKEDSSSIPAQGEVTVSLVGGYDGPG